MSRKYEAELELAAPVERVWRAIAEKEGIQSWFAPEARVTPGVGGEMWVSWAPGMEGGSKIEAWEPNRRQRYAAERGNGKEPNVVEFTIEAKSGGKTILRLVNSGFGDDASFDAELESVSGAWPLFLALLKHGVEHPHERCVNETAFRFLKADRDTTWQKVQGALPTDGEVRFWNPKGLACYELPNSNRSMLAIFCENCGGSTSVTVMCLLYDPTPEFQAEGRALAEKVANSAG